MDFFDPSTINADEPGSQPVDEQDRQRVSVGRFIET